MMNRITQARGRVSPSLYYNERIMPTCDCCRIVIRPNDLEAMVVSTRGRCIRLCREHARLIVAMLADLQLDPPIEVIR